MFLLLQGQRTVYRLTLVKSWNSEELQNYADLVSIGKPDFIEVKVNQNTQWAVMCTRCQARENMILLPDVLILIGQENKSVGLALNWG